MTRNTFIIRTDPDTGIQYVMKKQDELSKNHQFNDDDKITGYMPEMPNNPRYCPVNSFHTYINMLDPAVPWLWQMAKFGTYPDGMDIL